jgi:hypothetical protein
MPTVVDFLPDVLNFKGGFVGAGFGAAGAGAAGGAGGAGGSGAASFLSRITLRSFSVDVISLLCATLPSSLSSCNEYLQFLRVRK